MKKRIISLLLCALMLLSAFTAVPFDGEFFPSVVASAADGEKLRTLFDSIPEKEQWERLYIKDSAFDTLTQAYDSAERVLSNSSSSQDTIDLAEQFLRRAYEGINYHTLSIALNKSTATVNVGETLLLEAALDPKNAADAVEWISSNEDVASVRDGKVEIKKFSEEPVTVSAISNSVSASCKITVKNPIAGVSLSQSSATAYTSQKLSLTAKIFGADKEAAVTEEADSVTWSSTDETVARVSQDGVVEAYREGKTTVSVLVKTAGGEFKASCAVTVTKLIPVTSLNPQTVSSGSTLTMILGESTEIKVNVLPSNASIKELEWTSEDKNIVSIEKSGISNAAATASIKALKTGKTQISYITTDGSGLTGSFFVEVKPRVSTLSISPEIVVLNPGNTSTKINAAILPTDAGNQVLKWSSDNDSVCSVNYNGLLDPKKLGTCYITAATTDGSNITRKAFVRVAEPAISVTVSQSSAALKVGKSVTLSATVQTNTETYGEVAWTSSKPNVASVNSNGVVKGVYPGTATIRATALDGSGRMDVCTVTVTADVTGVEIPKTATVGVGKTHKLTATVLPEYAQNKAVTWKSNGESIVEVSADGTLTGKSVGTTTVECTTLDGGFTAVCLVTVVIPVTSVSVTPRTAQLEAGKTLTLVETVLPEDATDKSVSWSSTDEKVATVDENGLVTAVAGGKCNIVCKSNSSDVSVSCSVTVTQKVSGVSLETTSAEIYNTQSIKLSAEVIPSTATDKTLLWSTDDAAVATVSSTGVVTGIKAGTAVITVKTVDGGFEAQCVITVRQKTDVTGIKLNTTAVSLNKGMTYALDATISPSNASNKNVIWKSNASYIASVSADGLVTAVGTGRAVITATTSDGGYEAKCNVVVTQKVTGVVIDLVSARISVGNSTKLTATVQPSDAGNKSVKWESSNPKVASVNANGLVTAISAGTTTVSVTTAEGGYTAFCNVTVYAPVTGIKVNSKKVTLAKGGRCVLTATVLPVEASNREYTWKTSDSTVATVNAAGQVTALKVGTAVITATSSEGKFKANCLVEVVQLASKVTLNCSSVMLDAGKTKTIKATISPTNASDKTVKWKSSNDKIAKVSSNGVVTAVSAGTVTVTATSGDGNASASCKVVVTQKVTKLAFTSSSFTVKANEKLKLTYKVTPSNATEKNFKWSSSDKKIAKVSSSGVVTGVAAGKVKITVKTQDGKVKATCTVKVTVPAKGVSMSKTSLTIGVGKTAVLTANVKPKSATNKKVTWKSNNNDVVTVSSSGKITAKSTGSAVITATTKDGGFSCTCRVNVIRPVKSIKLNVKKKTVETGDSFTLKYTLNPSNPTNSKVKWSSSNKKVAVVNKKGVVEAVGLGTAKITVKTSDGGYTAVCTVTVVKKVTGVKLNRSSLVLSVSGQSKLKATVLPSNATNKAVTWSSSNKKVASVDKNGLVTGKKVGKAVITVKTKDGSFTAKCTVSVEIRAQRVTLKNSKVTVKSGKSVTLKYTLSPKNTTDKNLIWSSSNPKIATVNSKGVVTGVKGGKVTITAKTKNNKKARCTVTVVQTPDAVKLSTNKISIYEGASSTLKAQVVPSNANNLKVTFSSSNPKVATVTSKGVIKAVSLGQAVITVKAVENGKSAKCVVNVLRHASSVSISPASLSITEGTSKALSATVLPASASNKAVKWSTSNPSVAVVSQNGVVTAVSGGDAVITATTVDGGKTARCTVKVLVSVAGVVLEESEKTLADGETFALSATVQPSNASNKSLLWESSNENVATVDKNGVVTALNPGSAEITVKTVDGSFTAKATINVFRTAKTILLNTESATVSVGSEVTLSAQVLPEDTLDKTVTWESSDREIATVDENGVVTAHKSGTVQIIATAGSARAVCELKVNEPLTNFEIEESEITLYIGKTKKLTGVFTPENASDKTVVWSSTNEEVASVDENGVVTARSNGTAQIKGVSNDGSFEDVCNVTVLIACEEIRLGTTEAVLAPGEELEVETTVLPENAEDRSVTWASSNEEIATVDGNGKITAVSVGKATITVKSNDNCAKNAVEVEVLIPAEGLELSAEKNILWVGEKVTLGVAVTPENTTHKTASFKSLNEGVATVDENGVVTAVGVGECEIVAVSYCGRASGSFTLTVRQPVTEIVLDKAEVTLDEGSSVSLSASVLPENAFDKTLTWVSENEEIATVENGVVTARSKGETVVKAVSSSGNVSASCRVVVLRPVKEIALDKTFVSVGKGKTVALSASVSPADASDTSVTWKSEDPNIAAVDENGVVTALSKGETVVTAASSDGKVTASCRVSVFVLTESIALNSTSREIWLGETYTLVATVLPEDATDKTVLWESDNISVATVEDGVVTAKTKGEAVITAKTKDGGAQASFKLKVNVHAESVSFGQDTYYVNNGESLKLSASVLPENSSFPRLVWSSADPSVVSVDQNGVVTAHKVGTVKITALTEMENVGGECFVTVVQAPKSIKLDPSSAKVNEGEKITLAPSYEPEFTTVKDLYWSSSDENIAKVDENGVVTAVSKGEVTITARSKTDENVKAESSLLVWRPVKSFDIKEEKIVLYANEKPTTLDFSLLPEDASDTEVVWSSTDKSVATVENGVVTPVSPGTAVISGKTVDGAFTDICSVEVRTPIEAIFFTETSVKLEKGESRALKVSVAPSGASTEDLLWKSENEEIATVENGVVKARSLSGKVVITAFSKSDSRVKATCEVTVIERVTNVTISDRAVSLRRGEEKTLSAVVLPQNADDVSVTWKSENPAVATVENGVVKAVGFGKTTVTVTTNDGGFTDNCEVTVFTELSSLEIESEKTELAVGKTLKLVLKSEPAESDETVKLSSSNEDIAIVSDDGTVKALKAGTVKITAVSSISKTTAEIELTVTQPVYSVSFTEEKITVPLGFRGGLGYSFEPADATNKALKWESSAPEIVTVSQDGTIECVGVGEAVITIIAVDGGYSDTCKIIVEQTETE